MTLPQGHRAIIAGFHSPNEAEKARESLHQMGFNEIRIDRIGGGEAEAEETRLHNPITGDFPGLGDAVFERNMSRDESILHAVHPSASGLSDGENDEIGKDIVLTVVVTDAEYEKAAAVIRQFGGDI